ncbi:hypothetical protein V8E55_010085 [Tylopilus felleus]
MSITRLGSVLVVTTMSITTEKQIRYHIPPLRDTAKPCRQLGARGNGSWLFFILHHGLHSSLTNLERGTCIDLSGGDNYSIIGYGYHQGPNQAWIFQKADGDQTYYLKSAGSGQYLATAGDPSNGQKVVAGGSPYAWRIEDE